MNDASVLTACYNMADTIDEARASVPASAQHVVVDDHSDTPIPATIRLPDHRGLAAARNAGLAACDREWVAVLDADDALTPGYLDTTIEAGERTNADVVIPAIDYFDRGTGRVEPPDLDRESFRHGFPAFGCIVARRQTLVTVGGWPPGLGGQTDWGLQRILALHGYRFHPCPEATYRYRWDGTPRDYYDPAHVERMTRTITDRWPWQEPA